VREGMLDVAGLLDWALPRVADTMADPSHTVAAAILPMLQACIWVRCQSPNSTFVIAHLPVPCHPKAGCSVRGHHVTESPRLHCPAGSDAVDSICAENS
jgi:hypothetical protein